MTDKFQHKYRIPSARAAWWDYGNQGAYFITICTQHRAHYLGEIVETRCIASLPPEPSDHPEPSDPTRFLRPTEIGKIVELEWLKTPSIRPDMNLELDEFVVMPNHFHAIIWIGVNPYNCNPTQSNKFAPQRKNLASIIRGFKSSVTKYARINNIEFGWQERFHDHIIRNEDEYQRIKYYIINNPLNWNNDKFNN